MGDQTTCTTQQNRQNSLVFNIPKVRYTPINPYAFGYTQAQLDMRRKAEILQYNNTSTGKITKKQSWANVIRGSTQRRNFSSYYIKGIQDGTLTPEQICPNDISIPTLTTASDVPGKPMLLYYDASIPLYNYNTENIVYATLNTEEQDKWLIKYDTNVIDDNNQNIFTLSIRQPIDNAVYNYSVTSSIALCIFGYNIAHPGIQDVSGVFNINAPLANFAVSVMYGGQAVTLQNTPIVSFSPGFLQDISGAVSTRLVANAFNGKIYAGNVTFSNIILSTYPGNTYDFFIKYIPSYTISNIDDFNVVVETNVSVGSVKKVENGMRFNTTPSVDTITTFGLQGYIP
jgi:hypothetical protein